jgi:hypothetical protein
MTEKMSSMGVEWYRRLRRLGADRGAVNAAPPRVPL